MVLGTIGNMGGGIPGTDRLSPSLVVSGGAELTGETGNPEIQDFASRAFYLGSYGISTQTTRPLAEEYIVDMEWSGERADATIQTMCVSGSLTSPALIGTSHTYSSLTAYTND
jgi:hypothetical protein